MLVDAKQAVYAARAYVSVRIAGQSRGGEYALVVFNRDRREVMRLGDFVIAAPDAGLAAQLAEAAAGDFAAFLSNTPEAPPPPGLEKSVAQARN